MVAGSGISLLSAWAAGVVLVTNRTDSPEARMRHGFLAMVTRLAVVVVLGAAAVASGELDRTPLLVWLGVAYVALLPLEVRLAIL